MSTERPTTGPRVTAASRRGRRGALRPCALPIVLIGLFIGLSGGVAAAESAEAASLVAAAPITAPPSATLALADLDGRWRLLEDATATRDRLAAIDTAVEPLTWVVRKMASGVLRSSTAPRPTLDFVWDGRSLHERVPGKDRVESRRIQPGAPAFQAIDPRGEPFEGAWDWTPEGLRLRWRQHQAHGTNLYRMSQDKRTLVVDHSIQVTALDGLRPIAYRSRFAKDPLPAVASDADRPAR